MNIFDKDLYDLFREQYKWGIWWCFYYMSQNVPSNWRQTPCRDPVDLSFNNHNRIDIFCLFFSFQETYYFQSLTNCSFTTDSSIVLNWLTWTHITHVAPHETCTFVHYTLCAHEKTATSRDIKMCATWIIFLKRMLMINIYIEINMYSMMTMR